MIDPGRRYVAPPKDVTHWTVGDSFNPYSVIQNMEIWN